MSCRTSHGNVALLFLTSLVLIVHLAYVRHIRLPLLVLNAPSSEGVLQPDSSADDVSNIVVNDSSWQRALLSSGHLVEGGTGSSTHSSDGVSEPVRSDPRPSAPGVTAPSGCAARVYAHNTGYPSTERVTRDLSQADICAVYRRDGRRGRITIDNFYNQSPHNPTGGVTLATHLTDNRLQRLEEVAEKWKGYISAAVYVRGDALSRLATDICGLPTVSQRTNIHIRVSLQAGTIYPINYMRNLAVTHVKSPYVLLHDIDFIPSSDLEAIVERQIRQLNDSKDVLVVPVFEMMVQNTSAPKNKNELLEFWHRHQVQPSLLDYWVHSHAPTNYSRWKTASDLYEVSWRESYEPYVVARTASLPRFSDLFVGRWWDKIQLITELQARRFKFLVTPDGFMVHMPHDTHNADQEFSFIQCATDAYMSFLGELENKFGFVIPKSLRLPG